MPAQRVTVEFTSSAAIEAGTIAVQKMEQLLKLSKYGKIILYVVDGHVLDSELDIRERHRGEHPR